MALTKISTGGVKDDTADEAKLKVSNAGSNGEFLQKQSGNTGGLTWAAVDSTPEGTVIKSTGESGTAKFLRVDGDGTSSWQVPPDNNTVYTHPNHSGEVTSTADGAQVIADDVVDEANLKISNAGTNGQYLQKQSGNTGGLTWADAGGGAWELLNSGSDTSADDDAGTIIDGLQTTYSDYKVIKIEFYVHFANNTSYAGFQFKVGGSWLAGSGYHSQCEYGRHTNSSYMSQDTNSNSSITINEDNNDRCENIAGTLAWHRGPSSEDAMLTWDAKGMAYSGANYDFFLFNGAGGEAGTTNNTIQGIQWKNSAASNIWWKVIGMK